MANRMKILVGYDGSECADAALDDLRRAGLPSDAQIKVLSVVESWLPPPSGLEIIEQIGRDQEYLILARRGGIRLVSMEPGWDVKSESGAGTPATVIIEKADEWGADLIVAGSHGHTALGQFFFGSVSQKVLHEALRSVRVARGRIEEPDTPVRLIIGVDGSKGAEATVEAVAARKWPAGSEARIVNATEEGRRNGHERRRHNRTAGACHQHTKQVDDDFRRGLRRFGSSHLLFRHADGGRDRISKLCSYVDEFAQPDALRRAAPLIDDGRV